MKWIRDNRSRLVSECGRYEIRASWSGHHFAWRGRFVQTDELVHANSDRDCVQLVCERHADAIDRQVPA